MINPYAEIARLRSEMKALTAENEELREQIDGLLAAGVAERESRQRQENFWRCRHGFHKMDKASMTPTFPTPGYYGSCVRCKVPLRRSLV